MSSAVLDHFNDHTLRVFALQSLSKSSQNFSNIFKCIFSSQATFGTSPAFPVFPLWALLSLCVHAGTLPPLAQTGSVSWCLPYSLHMLSHRNGCLMICLHRSCRELFRFELRRRKGNERRRKKINKNVAVTSHRTTPSPWIHVGTWKSTVLLKTSHPMAFESSLPHSISWIFTDL